MNNGMRQRRLKIGQRVTVDRGMPTERTGEIVASFTTSRFGFSQYHVVALDKGFYAEDHKTFVSWLVVHRDNLVPSEDAK